MASSNSAASATASLSHLGTDRRDRIVVLGRRQAGKTVLLSVLYYYLWKNPSSISMVAMDGHTHQHCIENIDQLINGRWPSSTVGTSYLNFEVKYKGTCWPLVSLDYPGEVFKKAFIDGASTPDVAELLDHIDRAAAVLLLVDPAVVKNGELAIAAEDDFGMLRALERIWNRPGGRDIPMSFMLTKYDIRRQLIRDAGGLADFVKQEYRQILKASRVLRTYTVSVAREKGSQPRFDPAHEPHGLISALEHVLDQLTQQRQAHAAQEESARKKKQLLRHMEEESRNRKRSTRNWIIGWVAYALLFVIAAIVILKLTRVW